MEAFIAKAELVRFMQNKLTHGLSDKQPNLDKSSECQLAVTVFTGIKANNLLNYHKFSNFKFV